MNAHTFDRDVAPYLDRIQYAGSRICGGARDVSSAVRQIRVKPTWATLSEKELELAERALAEALDDVREARAVYGALPVEE